MIKYALRIGPTRLDKFTHGKVYRFESLHAIDNGDGRLRAPVTNDVGGNSEAFINCGNNWTVFTHTNKLDIEYNGQLYNDGYCPGGKDGPNDVIRARLQVKDVFESQYDLPFNDVIFHVKGTWAPTAPKPWDQTSNVITNSVNGGAFEKYDDDQIKAMIEPTPQKEKKTMFELKIGATLLNGKDVDDMSDDSLLLALSEASSQLKAFEDGHSMLESLFVKRQVTDYKKRIHDLTKVLDSRVEGVE